AARALDFELHPPVHLGVQRIVFADADVRARMEPGTALAHQYIAGEHVFAGKAFDAESLRMRVAPVARAASCLFMRHRCCSVFEYRPPAPWPVPPRPRPR